MRWHEDLHSIFFPRILIRSQAKKIHWQTEMHSKKTLLFSGNTVQHLAVQIYMFFHESSSPKPLKITLGSVRIFLKIRGDIGKSRCISGINDTGGKFGTGVNDVNYSGGAPWIFERIWNDQNIPMILFENDIVPINLPPDPLHQTSDTLKWTWRCKKNNENFSDWRLFSICHRWWTLSSEYLHEFSKTL